MPSSAGSAALVSVYTYLAQQKRLLQPGPETPIALVPPAVATRPPDTVEHSLQTDTSSSSPGDFSRVLAHSYISEWLRRAGLPTG